MLNELFPVSDNTPHVCESMFTFVQEIKLVLHYCTLKGSFYNFIWNENMISHRFSNQETFRIHLVQPQFTHPFPFQTEIFYLFLFSRHSWTCWKEKWTKIKNIIKWLIYEGLQLSVLRRWRISKILKHMNNDNLESSASWCILKSTVHLFDWFSFRNESQYGFLLHILLRLHFYRKYLVYLFTALK